MRLLTKREKDVARRLAEGMQNRDIARELKLSEHTIKNYLFHIFEKLAFRRVSRWFYMRSAAPQGYRLPASKAESLNNPSRAGIAFALPPFNVKF